MNPTEERILYNDYKVVKSLVKNDRNEIFLASRISDGLKVILKQSLILGENIFLVSKTGHEHDILKDLDHAGIPKVIDFLFEGKTAALVQEYIDGTDLRNLIFKKKLNYTEVLDIAIQLSDILHYLHQKGVIHKDINSGNVMITADGAVKLLDFGISSNLRSETNEILNVDKIEGTLTFISPEQTGRTDYSVSHTSDFYS